MGEGCLVVRRLVVWTERSYAIANRPTCRGEQDSSPTTGPDLARAPLTARMAVVPTPFQHLCYAQRVLGAPSLPVWLVDRLELECGAFVLGNTAGDVQSITGQPRLETHFYSLSNLRNASAVDTLLSAHPELSEPTLLSPAHAAFVSGYLVHLVWDQIWAEDIFIPLYRDSESWPDRVSRYVHHNALRIHLDRESYDSLDRERLVELLDGVTPAGWLPFVADEALNGWRDWLVEQLRDPDGVQTAAVFAERMNVPVSALKDIVDVMARGDYADVPDLAAALARYEAAGLTESALVLLRYWGIGPRLVPAASETMHWVRGDS